MRAHAFSARFLTLTDGNDSFSPQTTVHQLTHGWLDELTDEQTDGQTGDSFSPIIYL